ncbi:MAG: hypothetical protein JJU31_10260 [Wenzhouxiangella sp.]|nr:hypothetical protein [Wenzhouxiangella sp.]MCH8479736.1 hypothetical protein [Wenzhouxiangella sp.]TVR96444.1 MAG: hypothetical protein EA418_05520 [Wenzhouxiangellaceae bacterium]
MNREFLIPGIVALVLAALFPLYWLSGLFSMTGASMLEVYKADVTSLTAMDMLFVLIGVMEIYLYLRLRQVLQDQLQGAFAAGMALALAVGVGLFTATVLFDVAIVLAPGMTEGTRSSLILTAGVVSIGLTVLVGLIGLVLAIALLVRPNEGAILLKLFAVILMICSLLSITIILSPLVAVLYPLALVLLAGLFLRGGGEVEVV